VPFDTFDEGFRHEGDRCTFEVLALRFGIHDLAVRRLNEVVHDVDLKETATGRRMRQPLKRWSEDYARPLPTMQSY
jgi:hypothetical protein